jgi:hypothetical protein
LQTCPALPVHTVPVTAPDSGESLGVGLTAGCTSCCDGDWHGSESPLFQLVEADHCAPPVESYRSTNAAICAGHVFKLDFRLGLACSHNAGSRVSLPEPEPQALRGA